LFDGRDNGHHCTKQPNEYTDAIPCTSR